jgi:octaprenyl-diphosphate synthase
LTNVVKLDKERVKSAEALDRLKFLVASDLERVNQVILQQMQSSVPLIPQLAGHLVAAGGKRIRPMLTLAAAKLCDYDGTRHINLAACVEFIHTATLLHDDVVDDSAMRRGVETANALWGNEASVLVGDFLFSRAFQVMVADGSLRVLDILSTASAVIAEGEVHQLLTTNDTATSEDTYLDVIAAKTAALFAAACRIGAVVADRQRQEEEALDGYGRNLGIAFQIVDDALDYSSHSITLGKTVGDDFREGKITLPVILAYRRGTDEERQFWHRTLEEGQQDYPDIQKAIGMMKKYQALPDTVERARHYGAMAKDALGIFSNTDEKQILLDLVDFCIDRSH